MAFHTWKVIENDLLCVLSLALDQTEAIITNRSSSMPDQSFTGILTILDGNFWLTMSCMAYAMDSQERGTAWSLKLQSELNEVHAFRE